MLLIYLKSATKFPQIGHIEEKFLKMEHKKVNKEFYLLVLSVKIGFIPSPHLVECHTTGINSLLVSFLSVLGFSNLLCQVKSSI